MVTILIFCRTNIFQGKVKSMYHTWSPKYRRILGFNKFSRGVAIRSIVRNNLDNIFIANFIDTSSNKFAMKYLFLISPNNQPILETLGLLHL